MEENLHFQSKVNENEDKFPALKFIDHMNSIHKSLKGPHIKNFYPKKKKKEFLSYGELYQCMDSDYLWSGFFLSICGSEVTL